jgi:phosphoglycolate phosphatase-like HAD superfamily hydrolase
MRLPVQVLNLGFALTALAACNALAQEISPAPLLSWSDGATKQAIVEFVAKVTNEGGPDFVPPAERIATFDNDGTLWAEQPMYFQLAFALDRVKALAPQHPEWQTQEPFASILKGDINSALAGGDHALVEIVTATHAGMTTAEFEQIVKGWLAMAKHPKSGLPYTEMIYQPMLELLNYLRANGFKTYIVSGGGVEFMRVFSEKVYGIPPEQVVGSMGKLQFERRDNQPVLVKLPGVDFVDDKDGKPIGIQKFIGCRPIASFGNSDGDLQMLQWTTSGEGARFALIVHHTDPEREWAYDRNSRIGHLDKALDEATAKGWTVVDMKTDWKTIFPRGCHSLRAHLLKEGSEFKRHSQSRVRAVAHDQAIAIGERHEQERVCTILGAPCRLSTGARGDSSGRTADDH